MIAERPKFDLLKFLETERAIAISSAANMQSPPAGFHSWVSAQWNECVKQVTDLQAERDRLHALVNNPVTEHFLEAVRAEVAHQVERWGTVHDRAKEPQDWFWLVGYLAGKALRAHADGDEFKALHHTISTSAALANWWAHIKHQRGVTVSPGSSDLQRFLTDTFGESTLSGLEPSA